MYYPYYYKFFNFVSTYYYVEFEYLIIYSLLGIIKIKNNLLSYAVSIDNIMYHFMINESFSRMLNSFSKLIWHGHIKKYRIRGVGYRQLHYYGDLLKFKLRYTNVLFVFLPLIILTYYKHKRRRFHSLFGLNKQFIENYVDFMVSFRRSNIYTKKGFFRKNKIIQFKKKKKRGL